jgi:hypothetical protein
MKAEKWQKDSKNHKYQKYNRVYPGLYGTALIYTKESIPV